MSQVNPDSPVLHVIVVGFHHKKGCQIEYAYPPLIEGHSVESHEVPKEWKHLPSLALPDGAHRYTKDTIYFHLPSRDGSQMTVYGVSCYRQMDSKDLLNKTADVTRSSVQKSVCVLSKLPLYGLIKAKLELITHAYFDERDFSQVQLLEETYKNLRLCLTESLLDGGSQIFLDMSPRDVVLQFKHRILVIFKLLLLERRVLFSGGPVEKLCSIILSMLSLYPGMVEYGLVEAATYNKNNQISPTLAPLTCSTDSIESYLEIKYKDENHTSSINPVSSDTSLNMLTEEPESPTIPRDIDLKTASPSSNCDNFSAQQGGGALDGSANKGFTKQRTHSYNKHSSERPQVHRTGSRSRNSSENSTDSHRSNKLDETVASKLQDSFNISDDKRAISGCDSDNVNNSYPSHNIKDSVKVPPCDHVTNTTDRRTRSFERSVSQDSNQSTQYVVNEGGPFPSLRNMTQIEAVQCGKTIPNNSSVINIEDLAEKAENESDFHADNPESEFKHELLLSCAEIENDEIHRKRKTDFIEELDSPESISLIDKEDCFSWEEDKLLLAIEHSLDNSIQDDKSDVENSTELKTTESDSDIVDEADSPQKTTEVKSPDISENEKTPESPSKKMIIKNRLKSLANWAVRDKTKVKDSSNGTDSLEIVLTTTGLQQDERGFPMSIFTKGSLCHPYLCLQYYELLEDVNVRSFVIGATNALFKQKRHLTDVIIEINEGKIDVRDRELQKQLQLSTADLRFADILVKTVCDDKGDEFLNNTEWEGSDEWFRVQFKSYLQSLLITAKTSDQALIDEFGTSFIQAWKTTHNYKVWSVKEHEALKDIEPGHPCHGNLNVADLKVRFAHTIQNTERGKKINAAVTQTGKYVVQTGKAVGGAITNARSAVSSWFSSWRHNSDKQEVSENEVVYQEDMNEDIEDKSEEAD